MRTSKNLQATAPGASASTINTRKRVTSKNTAAPEIPENAQSQQIPPCRHCEPPAEPITKQTYRVRVHMLASVDAADFRNGILNTDNYLASSRLEAIGMAIERVMRIHRHHHVVADRIHAYSLDSTQQEN